MSEIQEAKTSIWSNPGRLSLLVLASMYVSWAFALYVNWGLQKGFGIKPGDNNFFEFLVHGVAAGMGGFYAGFFTRKKGVLAGLLVAATSVLILAALVFGILYFAVNANGVSPTSIYESFKNMDSEAGEPLRVLLFIFIPVVVVCSAIGGYFGERFAHHNNADDPEVRFFLRFDWKILLSALVIAECASKLILNGEIILLHLKWLLIGNFFVLIHPSIWFLWDTQGYGSFLMTFFMIGMLLIFYLPKIIYSIFQVKRRHAFLNSVIAIGAWLGIVLVSSLLLHLSKSPIHTVVDEVTLKGKTVWPILLTRETRPVAYDNLKLFYEKKGDKAKVEKYNLEAGKAYYALARYNYNGEISMKEAISNAKKAVALAPDNNSWRLGLGKLLSEDEAFDEASKVYVEAVQRSDNPDDILEAAYYFQDQSTSERFSEDPNGQLALSKLRQVIQGLSEGEQADWLKTIQSLEESAPKKTQDEQSPTDQLIRR
jgi:hypothetical protein